jgi:hypothetical protein
VARSGLALAGLILSLIPGAARAGDSVCWIQNGVLLVPAVAAGINGVFILDTGAATSQIDATQASEADIGATPVVGTVRVAGRVFAGVSMPVLELDARTRAFPTPIAGVLGADILKGQVLEVRPDPCRLRISPSRRRARAGMPVTLKDGVPYVRAAASDGAASAGGLFRIDTGSTAPVAFNPAALAVSGRLRGLSLGDRLFEDVIAVPRTKADDGALGAIGEPIWAKFHMRLDFGGRRLVLEPATLRRHPGPPGSG